jgi:hypothetical protein
LPTETKPGDAPADPQALHCETMDPMLALWDEVRNTHNRRQFAKEWKRQNPASKYKEETKIMARLNYLRNKANEGGLSE